MKNVTMTFSGMNLIIAIATLIKNVGINNAGANPVTLSTTKLSSVQITF